MAQRKASSTIFNSTLFDLKRSEPQTLQHVGSDNIKKILHLNPNFKVLDYLELWWDHVFKSSRQKAVVLEQRQALTDNAKMKKINWSPKKAGSSFIYHLDGQNRRPVKRMSGEINTFILQAFFS